MPVYRQRFYDEFDDSSVGLSTDLGAGSVSEAGTRLTLSFAAVNADWWGGATHNAPMAYGQLSLLRSDGGLYYFETLLDAYSASGNYVFGGAVLWADRNNAYRAIWTNYGPNYLYTQQIVADVGADLWNSGGNVGTPGQFAFRWYVNPTLSVRMIDVDGYALQPGWTAAYYKIGAGSWARSWAGALGFTPTRFGMVGGNGWGLTPSGSFGFNYLALYQEDISGDLIPGGTTRTDVAST